MGHVQFDDVEACLFRHLCRADELIAHGVHVGAGHSPRHWPGFDIRFRHGASSYAIAVENPSHVNRGVAAAELDGVALPLKPLIIPLADDGKEHTVRVVLG